MIFSRRRADNRDSLRLNLTPLIDMVFLLLVFFMMTTTFNKESVLRIDLPQASSDKTLETNEPIRIIITHNGEYAINSSEHSLTDSHLDTLRRALQEAVGDKKHPRLLISADANAPHQAVMRAMEAARDLGYVNIGFEAQQTPAAGST